jgi:hypothetical protein
LVLAASGCGSGSSPTARPPVAGQARTPKLITAATPHLSILSPRASAHTSSTLTVRVALSGAPAHGTQRFRYVLDSRLARIGSARLTFHDLAPGRHRLEVRLAATSTSRATTTFTVRTPRPIAVVVPAEAPHTTPVPAQPTRTTSTIPPPSTPPPSTKATTPAPTPKAVPPKSSGGIPQGGGGDGDSDNSGGPSDGDGNL